MQLVKQLRMSVFILVNNFFLAVTGHGLLKFGIIEDNVTVFQWP